jgi:N-acetylglucosaminyl-diphospho-decaprenol L-rhamnosyltransferase
VFPYNAKRALSGPIVSAPSSNDAAPAGRITVSVVSHGHTPVVEELLRRLGESHSGLVAHFVMTHNLPEAAITPPRQGWPFRFTEIFNPQPLGFGANHNRAFEHCATDFFCVLNPDIELTADGLWPALVREASRPGTGLAYPRLLNSDGSCQDNEREAVTPAALLRRHLLKQPQRRVDWISAAFWVVPARVYRRLGGFDERFFMYCEDTDFCLRLQLAGLALRRADVAVMHEARRGSRSPGRQLGWHLQSLMRLWSGPVLRQYLASSAGG